MWVVDLSTKLLSCLLHKNKGSLWRGEARELATAPFDIYGSQQAARTLSQRRSAELSLSLSLSPIARKRDYYMLASVAIGSSMQPPDKAIY
jgi:hypothetical protein